MVKVLIWCCKKQTKILINTTISLDHFCKKRWSNFTACETFLLLNYQRVSAQLGKITALKLEYVILLCHACIGKDGYPELSVYYYQFYILGFERPTVVATVWKLQPGLDQCWQPSIQSQGNVTRDKVWFCCCHGFVADQAGSKFAILANWSGNILLITYSIISA